MNMQKLKKWPLFHICGPVCITVAVLFVFLGVGVKVERAIFIGVFVSLPWMLLALMARLTGKALFKIAGVIVPLAIGLCFLKSVDTQNGVLTGILPPIAYFAALYGIGWLWLVLLIMVSRKRN
jgi:hypothetical protein